MKKIIMFTLVALCASCVLMAQRSQNFKFSLGTELLFPTGSFATGYSFGIGATAQAEIPVQQNLNVTGTTGIVFYNGKSLGGVKNTGLNIIPIKAGVKYFFTDGIYGAAQLGIGILNKGGGTAFAYTPAIGYEFRTRRGRALDVSFKYDGYSVKDYITRIGNVGGTLSEFGFRTALRF